LEGSGNVAKQIRLASPATLDERAIRTLMPELRNGSRILLPPFKDHCLKPTNVEAPAWRLYCLSRFTQQAKVHIHPN
jgi:hypothetical protein